MRFAGSTTCPLPGNRRSGEPLAQHYPRQVFTPGRRRESGSSQPFEEAHDPAGGRTLPLYRPAIVRGDRYARRVQTDEGASMATRRIVDDLCIYLS